MTSTIKETLNQFKHILADESLNRFLPEKPKEKFFIPSQSKLDELSEINSLAKSFIESFGFSTPDNVDYGELLRYIMNATFGLSLMEVNKITPEAKRMVIEQGLKGIFKSFIAGRRKFFRVEEMLEDDYKEKKLEYLLKHQEEPEILYSSSDYEYISVHFMQTMRTAAEHYFHFEGKSLSMNLSEELANQFLHNMMIKFNTVHESKFHYLYQRLQSKIEEGLLSEQDIQEYFSYPTCILSYMLDKTQLTYSGSLEEDILKTSIFDEFSLYLDYPQATSALLSPQSAQKVISYMSRYMTALKATADWCTHIKMEELIELLMKAPVFVEQLEHKLDESNYLT